MDESVLLPCGKHVRFVARIIFSLVAISAMAFALASCGSGSGDGGQVQSPLSSSSAEGMNYEDVALQFEKAGFTNVTTEGKGDLITGWLHDEGDVDEVSIDGKTTFSAGARWDPDAKVVIRYHSYPSRDSSSASSAEENSSSSSNSDSSSSSSSVEPSESFSASSASAEEMLEQAFPVDAARKAAVVSLTNAMAPDVYGSDGNSHDVSRYHSYSDRSGDYLELVKDGTWSAENESTWHVSNMELINKYGVGITASLDVTFDGTNYVISNLSGMQGEAGLGTSLDQYEHYYDDTWSYLTVTPDLLS